MLIPVKHVFLKDVCPFTGKTRLDDGTWDVAQGVIYFQDDIVVPVSATRAWKTVAPEVVPVPRPSDNVEPITKPVGNITKSVGAKRKN